MNRLNKTFEQNQILTAEELNAITGKVDEIVALLSSLDTGDSTVTDALIQEKVNQAKDELTALLNAAILNVLQNIQSLRLAVEGRQEVITEHEWAQYRKKIDDTGDSLASMIQLLEGEINIASLRETVDDLNALIGSINVSPGKLELVAGLFDENDNLVLPPASVIAAIVEDEETGELTSEVAISANRILMGGLLTLTDTLTGIDAHLQRLDTADANIRGDLTALNATVNGKATIAQLETVDAKITGKADISDLLALLATVTNLNVPDEATIKSAVIQDIEAGNVTITGTLNYNRLVGNVDIFDSTKFAQRPDFIINNNCTYVRIDSVPDNVYPILMLPSDGITSGLTLYILSAERVNIIPPIGTTAMLAGFIYNGTEEIGTGNGSDTETHYMYKWGITEYTNPQLDGYHAYDETLKAYNKKGWNNLKGAFVHSYIYTGSMWVETTSLQQSIISLTYTQKEQYGL